MKNNIIENLCLFIFPCFFMIIGTRAQIPQSADSLAAYLKKSPKDTNYVKALNEYGWKMLEQGNFALADSLGKQAGGLAGKLQFHAGEYSSYNTLGRSAYLQGKYSEALILYEKSLELVKKYRLSQSNLQGALANVAMINQLSGNNAKALDFALQSVKVYESGHLPKLSGSPHDVAGSVFILQGKNELGLQYFKQSLAIKTKDNNFRGMAVSANRIGSSLNAMEKYKEALVYLKQAEQYAEKVGYQQVLSDILINQSTAYRWLNQPKENFTALKKAEKICKEINSPHLTGAVYGNLGLYYQGQKQYPLAEEYLNRALKIFKDVGSLEYQGYLYQALTELFVEKKDFKSAFQNQKEAKQVNDSLFTESQRARMDELNARFESEKKEQQIKLLQQAAIINEQKLTQNKFLLAGGVLVLLLAGAITAWLLNRARVQRLRESLQLRNKIAADLHDEIGSTLSSISLLSGLTEKQMIANQPQKAEQLIHKISQDSRQMLESMDDIVWTINPRNDSMSTLLTRLREYAKPLADSKDIELKFMVSPEAENSMLTLNVRQNVYLIVKEAINNLFKYAQATEAEVRFDKKGKNMEVVVKDNGVGFDSNGISNRNGLKNMHERAATIGAKLEIDSNPENGTVLSLLIPG
jgi:two-component system sensor histidine kinase UhpB